MKALVYTGKEQYVWVDRPLPTIKHPKDIIVRMHKTTICGTDLHILHGNVETCKYGNILGHEGIGIVEAIGSEVKQRKVGERVLISCITSCGSCIGCLQDQAYGLCTNGGGWLLGNVIDGCQAEYVRVPFGDYSCYTLPKNSSINEDAYVMLSDILPTGLEVGALAGKIKPGDTVAIVGVGPVGLSAVVASTPFKPSKIFAIDVDDNRLERAKSLGATDVINNSNGKAIEEIMRLTNGKGVHVVIEAIGLPIGWDISESIVAAGGTIALLGVHGKSVTLHLERMWRHNFTLTTGMVHTNTIPSLLEKTLSGEINPLNLISHRFKMSDMCKAYYTFSNASKTKSLKVIIENDFPYRENLYNKNNQTNSVSKL
jgi:alcohol dehydrogenase